MSTRSRLFLLVPICVFFTAGCGSRMASDPVMPAASVEPVVTIADLHFNPLYDASLYGALAAADPSQWAAIYQGSAVKTVSVAGTDTNYPLLTLALSSMKQNMAGSPVVLCTGDLLGHNIPQMFFAGYYGTKNYPTPDATAIAAMGQFIDNTVAFVAAQIRQAAGDVPVLYAPGNIDAYESSAGPEPSFLAANAETVYKQFLMSGTDPGAFLSTFTLDGYYAVQPLGSKLLVIVLNTNSFVAGVPSSGFAAGELDWMSAQLAGAKAAGQRVWILMHVPPGANARGIAQNAAIPSDVDDSTVSMMWDAGIEGTFMQKLGQFPGLVTMILAGHTHMDEFRILPTGDVLEQLPGISPCFGNNPAYKVLSMAQDTFTPTDYTSFDYDLANRPAQFTSLYEFSAVYGTQNILGTSLQQLYPGLASDSSTRDFYTLLYGSGTTSMNPVTLAPWNPINRVNWPIFGCTIGKMDGPGYIRCVNTK
jgi:sphingomyelin phosphodiesterase acid-like 3